jgi:hypothetical protein
MKPEKGEKPPGTELRILLILHGQPGLITGFLKNNGSMFQ